MKDSEFINALNAIVNEKSVSIGDIDFEESLFTEDSICEPNFGSRIGKASVEVRSQEGDNIPHFHVISKSNNINIAVRIDIADYFVHPHAPNVFYNSKQTKELDSFLRKLYKRDKSISNWKAIVDLFNIMHNEAKTDVTEQPDYTTLETNKKGRLK